MVRNGGYWSLVVSIVVVSCGHAFRASVTVGGEFSAGEAADDDVRPSLTVTSPMSVCSHTHADRHWHVQTRIHAGRQAAAGAKMH